MNLQLKILQSLSQVSPMLMTVDIIVAEARLGEMNPPTRGDVLDAMNALERDGAIGGTSNPDLGNRYKITDAGKLRLREAGL